MKPVDERVHWHVYQQVDIQQVRKQVDIQVWDQVRGQVYGPVVEQVSEQVYKQVRGQVYKQVRGQSKSIGKSLRNSNETSR